MRDKSKPNGKYGNNPIRYCKFKWADADGVTHCEFDTKDIVGSHTKRYHNCLYLLAGLSSCARDLMDYITEQMDSDNVVSTNEHFREKFIKFISANSEVSYSDSSVKRSLRLLTEKGLLRQKKRGYSVVNPEFFFKNDDKRRFELIKIELQFKAGTEDAEIKVTR